MAVRVMMFMRVFEIVTIFWYARRQRNLDKQHLSEEEVVWPFRFFCGMAIVWVVSLSRESILLYSYSRETWLTKYLFHKRTIILLSLLLEPYLLFNLCREVYYHQIYYMPHFLLTFVGIIAWWSLMRELYGLAFCDLGAHILPINYAVGDSIPFLIVIFFFFGACWNVSYCWTNGTMTQLLDTCFQMSFAGQYDNSLFFDGRAARNDGLSETTEWILRFLIYVFFGILIMVILQNIFIGLLSDAFKRHKQRSEAYFVQFRARESLDWLFLQRFFRESLKFLLKQGYDEHATLWVCCADEAEVAARHAASEDAAATASAGRQEGGTGV